MKEADWELAQKWYDHKSTLMETSLGKEHDVVMHAPSFRTKLAALTFITTRMEFPELLSRRRNYPSCQMKVRQTGSTNLMS